MRRTSLMTHKGAVDTECALLAGERVRRLSEPNDGALNKAKPSPGQTQLQAPLPLSHFSQGARLFFSRYYVPSDAGPDIESLFFVMTISRQCLYSR